MSDAERAAYAAALTPPKTLARGEDIARDSKALKASALVLEGFAVRLRALYSGRAQILSFVLPGDIMGFAPRSGNDSIKALGPTRVAYLPYASFRELIEDHPRLALVFWRETLMSAAIYREWVVSLGARDAYERIAHLLCELYVRFCAIGLTTNLAFKAPLSQTVIADATGLSVVHVNRTVQRLKADGLATVTKKSVVIHDWTGLRDAGDFDDAYLSPARLPV
jgi:CRP-like cAMP-binding protein